MLYEFSFNFRILDLAKILTLILPLGIYLYSSTFEKTFFRVALRLISFFLTSFIIFCLFILPLYSFFSIKKMIKCGEVFIIQGEVENFKTPESSFGGHESESFTIDGIDFCYYGTENYGYSDFLCEDGVILGNGQQLKVTYCYDPVSNDKVICYIERFEI